MYCRSPASGLTYARGARHASCARVCLPPEISAQGLHLEPHGGGVYPAILQPEAQRKSLSGQIVIQPLAREKHGVRQALHAIILHAHAPVSPAPALHLHHAPPRRHGNAPRSQAPALHTCYAPRSDLWGTWVALQATSHAVTRVVCSAVTEELPADCDVYMCACVCGCGCEGASVAVNACVGVTVSGGSCRSRHPQRASVLNGSTFFQAGSTLVQDLNC